MTRCLEKQELRDDAVVLYVRIGTSALNGLSRLLSSKEQARKVLARGGLSRGGVVLAGGDALAPGDVLELTFSAAEQTATSAGPVRVIYQDRLMMAVDKPAGILVHGDGSGADTLTARVQGLLVGTSSGANVWAAKQAAGKYGADKTIATVLPDRAERYFSTALI